MFGGFIFVIGLMERLKLYVAFTMIRVIANDMKDVLSTL